MYNVGPPIKKNRKVAGFAMILSLALISFVFLLVITLVSEVRQGLAYSDARQNHILAKAHARMGMMIAIGEIQKHLGPDTRVSATADIYDERVESSMDFISSPYPQTTTISNAVDLNEDNLVDTIPLGQRMWTGVWKHRGQGSDNYLDLEKFDKLATRALPYNSDPSNSITESWSVDTSFDHHPAVELAWLVSGNEGWHNKLAILNPIGLVQDYIEVPDGIYIDDEGNRVIPGSDGGVYGKEENAWRDHRQVVTDQLENYFHPLSELGDPDKNDSVTWMLKAPVTKTDGTYAADPVKVPKSEIKESSGKKVGNYAYWVGDQGVLAKVNIPEVSSLNNESRLMVATSPNLQSLNLNTGDLRNLTSLSFLPDSEKASTLSFEEARNWIGTHYHDTTVDSFGVLSDTRTGGLKRDLSHAFSRKKSDRLWLTDFENNWVFRDKISYKKEFPLNASQAKANFDDPYDKKVHKNQWLYGDLAPVNDEDALLAGPLWSVLYDFHNLTDSTLEVTAPTQFPRIVGDNAVIFKPGESPAPAKQFPVKANKNVLKFFNSFRDENENAVRPEPENHPITPILTRIKLNINLAISNASTMEVNLVITPTLSLWNPYDKPMRVKDLYVTWTPADISFAVFKFDLAEYDLFRKWWMYFSKPQNQHSSPTYTNKMAKDEIKNWNTPWSAFSFTDYNYKFKEYGVMLSKQVSETEWLEGLKMNLEKKNGKWVYPHDYPVDGLDPEFIFHSYEDSRLQNRRFAVKNLHLKLEETILAPGEAAGFGVELEEADYDANEPLRITLRKGEEDEAFLIKTGFTDFSFGGYDLSFKGMKGVGDGTSDSLIYEQNGFGYSPIGDYFMNGVTMYKWEGGTETFDPGDPRKAKKIYSFPYDMQDNVGRTDQVKLLTGDWLLQAWEDRNDHSSGKLPGQSISLEMSLPGERRNENITLNDFNLRHFIHGQQQGMGSLYYTRYLSKGSHFAGSVGFWVRGGGEHTFFSFKEGASSFNLKTPIEPFNSNSDLYQNTFDIPTGEGDPGENTFNKTRLSFPDIFSWSGDEFDATIQTILDFNNQTDLLDRMEALGFVQGSQYNLYTDPNYPHSFFLEPEDRGLNYSIRRWGNTNTYAGFYLDDEDLIPSQNQIEAVKNAVLFETPKETTLSILQYRHANLNSYLHGPSYALGNGYASTQVGRHRSYGRNQTIMYAPTSEGGLTPSEIRNMEKIQNEYLADVVKDPQAKLFKQSKETFEAGTTFDDLFGMHDWGETPFKPYPSHNIDFNQGFAPWRSTDSGMQLSHQNITIDHSFYLNRSLLDGYFLSGYNAQPTATSDNPEIGARFTPFVYSLSDSEKQGNPRLISYYRDGQWSETEYGSSTGLTNKQGRYQSLAGDLLVDGVFNINSTSVDAWIAQLSSLRGQGMERASGADVPVSSNETPVVRFLNEPDNSNSWNTLRKLSDEEISDLAKSMVKQVKLRGPFLSFSDFVNRRLAPGPQDPGKSKGSFVNFMEHELSDWKRYAETRDTVTGLRGAVQSAIANAGLNDTDEWVTSSELPKPPQDRWIGDKINVSEFGLKASSTQKTLWKNGNQRWWGLGALNYGFEDLALPGWAGDPDNFWGQKISPGGDLPNVPFGKHEGYRFKPHKKQYKSNNYGEAPENFLAVEHLASGANKPGWVMQSDILSPLAPVTSARSDTFTIRVMGETDGNMPARTWIELVVQRTPDYVKADVDAPHHRPHEPFKDLNLNGYWDNSDNVPETWIDLNRNGDKQDTPDLPGSASSKYRDGMPSDLGFNLDGQEESDDQSEVGVSFLGINQRFGRKFKIVRFRWLREQDV